MKRPRREEKSLDELAYDQGQAVISRNNIAELVRLAARLPGDIEDVAGRIKRVILVSQRTAELLAAAALRELGKPDYPHPADRSPIDDTRAMTPTGTVSYTYDHFTVRDEHTGKALYFVPYDVYEQIHALATDPEVREIIKRVQRP